MAATKKPTQVNVTEMDWKGGKARAKSMTKEERSARARNAVQCALGEAEAKKGEEEGLD